MPHIRYIAVAVAIPEVVSVLGEKAVMVHVLEEMAVSVEEIAVAVALVEEISVAVVASVEATAAVGFSKLRRLVVEIVVATGGREMLESGRTLTKSNEVREQQAFQANGFSDDGSMVYYSGPTAVIIIMGQEVGVLAIYECWLSLRV